MTTNKITGKSLNLVFDLKKNSFDILPFHGAEPKILHASCGLTLRTEGGQTLNAHLPGESSEWREIPIKDVHGNGKQFQIVGIHPTTGLKITYLINSYENQPFLLLRMLVENLSRQTYKLDGVHLLQAEHKAGGSIQFGNNKRWLDFFMVGWHDWVYSGLRHGDQRDIDSLFALKPFTSKMLYNPVTPIGKRRGDFWSDGWGILTDQKHAIVAGLISTANQFGLLHADCRSGHESLTLTALADGILFDPGEIFTSEWGYVQFLDLPVFDPLTDYVDAVARQMKARVPKTPPDMQWTHWYYYFEHITEKEFLKNLDAADALRKVIPYKIFQLDGGYYPYWGDWTETNERFPIGLKKLSKRIREKDFTPGLWLAPFVVDPRSKVAQAHPDWLVKDDAGKPIKSGYFYDFYGNALDMSHPAAQDHIRNLLDKLVHDWGYEWIKTDFVYAGALPGVRLNKKMTRAQAFRKGMECVREGIGEETFLLGCGCPMGPAIGIVDAIRVGPDTAPNWAPFLWNMKWATPLLKEERSIAALRNNIRQTINMSSLHRKWWWNDPDCLMVREDNTTLTRDEVISNVSLMGLNSGLVIHSDDLTKLTPEHLKLVSLLTPILGNDARALDLLEHEMAEHYVLPQEKACGDWKDVALFNWSDSVADCIIDLGKLGYTSKRAVHVFDFWEERYWVQKDMVLKFKQIPKHGCKLLRICEISKKPTLVGDTLHITQGGEISTWKVVGKSLTVQTIPMARDVSGALWIWLPGQPKKAVCNKKQIKIQSITTNVFRFDVSFENKASIEIQY